MDLFLIAHKVRGEPAFDIAERMDCPYCIPTQNFRTVEECVECSGDGFWWIVSTSGHRAYPWRSFPLSQLEGDVDQGYFEGIMFEMPPSLPDHYPTRQAKPEKSSGKGLLAALGLLPKVVRRL